MYDFRDWLSEIADSPLTVDASEVGLSREAHDNCWAFSFTQEQIESLSSEDLIGFLDAVAEIYQSQLSEWLEQGLEFIFYYWFDEQASQLRLSVVSASHGILPFSSPIQVIPDINQMVERFLSSPYHDGLPLEEFVEVTQIGSGFESAVQVPPLQVWTKSLLS